MKYQAAQKSCTQHTSEIQETVNVLPHPQPGPLNLFYWNVLSFSSSYKSAVNVITLLALEKTKPCLANNVWTELEWEGSTVNKKYLSNAWETHSAAAGNKWACEDWAHLWLNMAYRVFSVFRKQTSKTHYIRVQQKAGKGAVDAVSISTWRDQHQALKSLAHSLHCSTAL